MAGMLNIGFSGLMTAQSRLDTTSHNITNANTPGYHRQDALQSTRQAILSGNEYYGQGVRVESVVRSYDQFLERQVLAADTRRAAYSAYHVQARQLDELFADPSVSLTGTIDAFFAGVQDVADDPNSIPARTAMISSAQTMVDRFHAYDQRLGEIRTSVEGEILNTFAEINRYADAIAEINQKILIAQGADATPNDLLDQRNQQVTELNRLIRTNTVMQSDGQMSVFIASGQALVSGSSVQHFSADSAVRDITLVSAEGARMHLPEGLLGEGKIGGLLRFRSETLDYAQNRVGLIATTLAAAFNEQHKQGVDLDGAAGGDFFSLPAVGVQPGAAARVGIDPAKIGQLTDADYQLRRDGTTYTLSNLATGASASIDTASEGTRFSFEGLDIDVDGSLLADEESALVQPTRAAPALLQVLVSDPVAFAAAARPADFGSDSYRFTSVEDNRNVNLLGVLQTGKLFLAGESGAATTTIAQTYAQLVGVVGSRTSAAAAQEKMQEALLNQAESARNSVSGVNIDEEAANLLRYQSAYQASARVMTVAQRLFDELFSIFN